MDPQSVLDVLKRTSRGEGTFPELAEALKSLEGMRLVIPPGEFARFTQDLSEAFEKKGYGNVKVHDAQTPSFVGLTTGDGEFVPRAFTDDAIAREYAVTSGLIEPDDNVCFVTKDWTAGLHEFLAMGWGGVIIDSDTDHQVNLPRKPLARLLALMTLEEFARIPELHVVTNEGSIFYQSPDGQAGQVFVFDNEKAAAAGLQHAMERVPTAGTQLVPTRELLPRLLQEGLTLLVVNPSLVDERSYNRDDVVRMTDILITHPRAPQPTLAREQAAPPQAPEPRSAPPEPVQPPAAQPLAPPPDPDLSLDIPDPPSLTLDPDLSLDLPDDPVPPPADPSLDPTLRAQGGEADRAGSGAKQLPAPMVRAAKWPTLPRVAPPQVTDEENRTFFLAWHDRAAAQTCQPWELTEALAFETRFYVPIHPRNVEGLNWPQFFRHPDKENETVSYLYTTRAAFDQAFSTSPPECRSFHELSGIEAMRWVWGAPGDIGHLAVDWPDERAWFMCPSYWALNPLFPIWIDAGDLAQVEDVPLARLAQQPGARPLKPQILKALVSGWNQILGLAAEGEPITVEHLGGRYLPVFSDRDQLMAWAQPQDASAIRPEATSGEAPFGRWLEASVEYDGLIYNPASPWPLLIEHFDLLTLSLWCRMGGRPKPSDLISETGRLLHDGKIPSAMAGRFAAEIPRFVLGVQRGDNGNVAVMQVPGSDTCCLFSDPGWADSYIGFYRKMNLMTEEMKQVPVLSRWDRSALHMAAENFESAWIDVMPMGGGGLYLDREAMDAAVEALDRRLKPRVPHFVAEP